MKNVQLSGDFNAYILHRLYRKCSAYLSVANLLCVGKVMEAQYHAAFAVSQLSAVTPYTQQYQRNSMCKKS